MSRYPNISTDGQRKYRRLRVDVGQTGFFAGREFKCFYEFNLSSGVSQVLRINAPLNVIMQDVSAMVYEGVARFEILDEDGTQGGTFGTTITSIRTNRMTTADLTYTGQVVVTTGGTYTGGTVNEVIQLNAGNGSGAHNEIVSDSKPYGLDAGLYYVKITAIGGTAKGTIKLRYEERPAGV